MPAMAQFVDIAFNNYTVQFEVGFGVEVSAVPSDFPTLPAKLDQVDTAHRPWRTATAHARLEFGITSVARENKLSAPVCDPVSQLCLSGTASTQDLQVVRFLNEFKTPKAMLHAELLKGLGTLKDEYII